MKDSEKSIAELMRGMKKDADEILDSGNKLVESIYETTRKLKDGRIKNTVTGYIEEPVTSSIDDAPVTLGSR